MRRRGAVTGPGAALIRLAFGTYSYAENVLRIAMELLPHPVRFFIYKLLFARLGAQSMIDYQSYFRYPWKMRIGRGVWINRGCEFYGAMMAQGGEITIGDHCAFGPHVRILTATHDYSRLDLPDTAGSVTIGDHVWVGAGATILPGVTIGSGAVVAAGSVVTRDVAPFTIVAGDPARFIKTRELESESAVQ